MPTFLFFLVFALAGAEAAGFQHTHCWLGVAFGMLSLVAGVFVAMGLERSILAEMQTLERRREASRKV